MELPNETVISAMIDLDHDFLKPIRKYLPKAKISVRKEKDQVVMDVFISKLFIKEHLMKLHLSPNIFQIVTKKLSLPDLYDELSFIFQNQFNYKNMNYTVNGKNIPLNHRNKK